MQRPLAVWIVSPVLALCGVAGSAVIGPALLGAEDSAVPVLGLATLLCAAQVAAAAALFLGGSVVN
ncbi:hypothetical protein ACPPVO_58545 [Dactylosporangium sp. McL0621]|uniref:hypothetical protein n=1 Tax=Dactylosporangium sp. McL0621 TaxID=3415678 RepID=UPI003CF38546